MVKLNVKPAAVFAVVTILAILVIVEVIALADTNSFPPVVCAARVPGNINLVLPHHIPLPSLNLSSGTYQNQPVFGIGGPAPDHGNPSPNSLAPGIYETRPCAIALKIPGPTGDNCVRGNSSPSLMPIQHPKLETIPKVVLTISAK